MSQADSLRAIAALWDERDDELDRLRTRCDELNEACAAKQVLIDHTASDLRDMRDMYEKESDTLRAEVERLREALRRVLAAALVNLANAEKEIADLRALLAAQEARAQRVEQAARAMLAKHREFIGECPDGKCDCTAHELEAALSQPAATGEGADYMHGSPPVPPGDLMQARFDRVHKEVGTGRAAKVGKPKEQP